MNLHKKLLAFALLVLPNLLRGSTKEFPIKDKTYTVEKQIASLGHEGCFSDIFRVVDNKGKLFAIKAMNKDLVLSKMISRRRDDCWNPDAKILEKIQSELPPHPGIIRMFAFTEPDKKLNFFLLLEYIDSGDLFDFMEKNPDLPDDQIETIVKQ